MIKNFSLRENQFTKLNLTRSKWARIAFMAFVTLEGWALLGSTLAYAAPCDSETASTQSALNARTSNPSLFGNLPSHYQSLVSCLNTNYPIQGTADIPLNIKNLIYDIRSKQELAFNSAGLPEQLTSRGLLQHPSYAVLGGTPRTPTGGTPRAGTPKSTPGSTPRSMADKLIELQMATDTLLQENEANRAQLQQTQAAHLENLTTQIKLIQKQTEKLTGIPQPQLAPPTTLREAEAQLASAHQELDSTISKTQQNTQATILRSEHQAALDALTHEKTQAEQNAASARAEATDAKVIAAKAAETHAANEHSLKATAEASEARAQEAEARAATTKSELASARTEHTSTVTALTQEREQAQAQGATQAGALTKELQDLKEKHQSELAEIKRQKESAEAKARDSAAEAASLTSRAEAAEHAHATHAAQLRDEADTATARAQEAKNQLRDKTEEHKSALASAAAAEAKAQVAEAKSRSTASELAEIKSTQDSTATDLAQSRAQAAGAMAANRAAQNQIEQKDSDLNAANRKLSGTAGGITPANENGGGAAPNSSSNSGAGATHDETSHSSGGPGPGGGPGNHGGANSGAGAASGHSSAATPSIDPKAGNTAPHQKNIISSPIQSGGSGGDLQNISDSDLDPSKPTGTHPQTERGLASGGLAGGSSGGGLAGGGLASGGTSHSGDAGVNTAHSSVSNEEEANSGSASLSRSKPSQGESTLASEELKNEETPEATSYNYQNHTGGGDCAVSEQIGTDSNKNNYRCSGVSRGIQNMNNMSQMSMMMGQMGTSMGGEVVQSQAMSSGSQAQLMSDTAKFQMATGGVQTGLGMANVAMALKQLADARRLKKNAQALEEATNAQVDVGHTGVKDGTRNLGSVNSSSNFENNSLGYAQVAGGTSGGKAAAEAIIAGYGLNQAQYVNIRGGNSGQTYNDLSTQQRQGLTKDLNSRHNLVKGNLSDIAHRAAAEQAAVADQAMQSGTMAMIQGLQQASSGAMAIAQGKMLAEQAAALGHPVYNPGQLIVPASGALGNGANGGVTPAAITGDGAPQAAGATAANTLDGSTLPGLGTPINPNPFPSGPPNGGTPQSFVPDSNNQSGGGGSNGSSGLGTASTDPSQDSSSGAAQAAMSAAGSDGFFQNPGTAMSSGGGAGGGKGSGADGGPDLNGPLAQWLANMKKEDPTAKTDIRDFGNTAQDMSTIPYTPYGKEANLMERVSDRIRFEHQTGRVGE